MGLISSYGVGQYSAGHATEAHAFVANRRYTPNTKRGFVYLLGAGTVASNDLLGLTGSSGYFALGNYPSISADCGSTTSQGTWANPTGVSRMTDATNYFNTAFGAKIDKIGLVGVSHGSLTCLAWAVANASKVAFLYLALPACDVQDIHDNRAAGLATVGLSPTSIENAYGGLAGYNAAMPASNPAANDSTLAGVPARILYSSNDPIVDTSTVTALAAAIGPSCTLINTGANGHSTGGYNDTGAGAFVVANL